MDFICIFVFSGYNGTQKAYADLFSGSAAEFENQYKQRTVMLVSCIDEICKVPAYTAYPFNTFHSDLDSNHEDWWNFLYGKYNGNKQVTVDYNDLIPFYSQTIEFNPADTFIKNYNIDNLTDSVVYKGGYSYHMSPFVEYGGGVSFSLDTIETRYGNQPAYLKISSDAFFTDSLRNMHVVSVINGKSGNLISWRSVTWQESKPLSNGWENAELLIPLYMLDIHLDSEFKIFLWNPEKRDAFVDNISFNLY